MVLPGKGFHAPSSLGALGSLAMAQDSRLLLGWHFHLDSKVQFVEHCSRSRWGVSHAAGRGLPRIPCVASQATLRRLQDELEGQQGMLQARAEGETLLKAEVVRLTEENMRLRDEGLEHQGTAMGLQERLAELEQGSGASQVPIFPSYHGLRLCGLSQCLLYLKLV